MTEKIDAIGDVHGSASKLRMMLRELGYGDTIGRYIHPNGRIAVFTGDIVDSGARTWKSSISFAI